MLVRMGLFFVMAPITRVHLGAAREAEPPVAFGVMTTSASAWEFLAGDDAEIFLGDFAAEWEQVPWVKGRVGHEGEFRFGDLEAESAVAFAANRHAARIPTDRNHARGGHGGAAGGTCWGECAGEHVGNGAAGEVEVTGTERVDVHRFAAKCH